MSRLFSKKFGKAVFDAAKKRIRHAEDTGSSFEKVSKCIEEIMKNEPHRILHPDSPGESFRKTLTEAEKSRKRYSPYSG